MANSPLSDVVLSDENASDEEQSNNSYVDIKTRNKFHIRGNKTFYRPSSQKEEEGQKQPIFIECMLEIQGYLEDETNETNGSWVCSCKGLGRPLELETR